MQEEEQFKKKKKKKKKKKGKDGDQLKELNLGRGVEIMYWIIYCIYVNLSFIVDNKVNIMLLINVIIILIVVFSLVFCFFDNFCLILFMILLFVVCLLVLVFVIFFIWLKVIEGWVIWENIENKNFNLFFFGNFYNMELNDFYWGMMEMICDSDFLYSFMMCDLYYFGVVLAKKYKYLCICYGIFMYGLIVFVIVFVLVFVMVF